MNAIPSVDLRDFLSEDPQRKEKFIREKINKRKIRLLDLFI